MNGYRGDRPVLPAVNAISPQRGEFVNLERNAATCRATDDDTRSRTPARNFFGVRYARSGFDQADWTDAVN
jgi:hypothetical protein